MKPTSAGIAIPLVVSLFASRVIAAPVVGPALPIDTPVDAPYGGAQYFPSIAFDGTSYLVLWADHRNLGDASLYGARVDKSGIALEPRGLKIADNTPVGAEVAFGGGQYLACWTTASTVTCLRLDAGGKPLDSTPIALGAFLDVDGISVAWNGTVFLVVWGDRRSGDARIYGARVTKAGAVLDAGGFAVAASTKAERAPRAASDGKDFFVVWGDDRTSTSGPRAFGARVQGDGTVLDPQGLYLVPSADNQFYPVVCFDGGNYHVAWENTSGQASGANGMGGALVSPTGETAVAGIVLSATSTSSSLSIACNSSGSMTVWPGNAVRVDPAGKVLSSTGLAVPPSSLSDIQARVSSDGANFLLVWRNVTSGSFFVDAVVSAAGVATPAAGQKLLEASNTEQRPGLARGSSGYLAVWSDDRVGGKRGLYGIRLDDTGAAVGSVARLADTPDSSDAPLVAWNGTHYLVAWVTGNLLNMVRTDAQGKAVDAQPVLLANSVGDNSPGSSAQVVSDGSGFLAVWQDTRNSTYGPPPLSQRLINNDVFAARIADDGTVLDKSGILVAGGTAQQTNPAAVFDGSSYLVAWTDDQGLRGLRIDRSGAAVDATPVAISSTSQVRGPLAVAFAGGTYLVAWVGPTGPRGRHCSANLTPVDATDFALLADPSTAYVRGMAASWGGQSFLVAFTGTDDNGAATTGVRVGPTGGGMDQNGFAIEPAIPGAPWGQNAFPTEVGLASDGKGHWLVLSDRYDPAANAETVRVKARLVTDCTGSSCPQPPDGGVRPDASPGDAGAPDVLAPDANADSSKADAGAELPPRADAARPDAPANEVLADRPSGDDAASRPDAASADSPAERPAGDDSAGRPDAALADGPAERPSGDAAQDGKAPAPRASSGCGCTLYGGARGHLANGLGLAILALGLWVRRARRRPHCEGSSRDTL
jgi:hypothetical protein